ncbi:hypothetical protein LA080_013037 [Diaporthe eres]|nr:hypothetical protein LA080_013037 [Diaporthe eres]
MAEEYSNGMHMQYRWVTDAPSRSQRIPKAHWDTHKAELGDLYYAMSLDDLMAFMKEKHGFAPTRRQYTYQFEKWSFTKYRKETTHPSGPATQLSDAAFDPFCGVVHESRTGLETCEHGKRHRTKRGRHDPQLGSTIGTSSQAESTQDTAADETCSSSCHASKYMGNHSVQCNLMTLSNSALPLRPDRGDLNGRSSFFCEPDIEAPSTSLENCKEEDQKPDFPSRWDSVEELCKSFRAITSQRPVSTYTAKDMDHIQLAAEYLEAMGYEEDAFSLYALLLKKLHEDGPRDKATFLNAIINYSRCVSTPGHCEIIQHHLRDQAQQLSEEVSSCLLYQLLIEMALAETYSRKYDTPAVKTHLRKARQLIPRDNGFHQVTKQLPHNNRENLLPREDPKEFTSWEFDVPALERTTLHRVPGPFELKYPEMGNPCVRQCLQWCYQKLQQLRYVSGPWMEVVSSEKKAHKERIATVHRMFLFTCLWNIWINEPGAANLTNAANTWMWQTHSRLGVNATELLMITCAQIVHESGSSKGSKWFPTELELIWRLRRGAERLLGLRDDALARCFLNAFLQYRTLEEEESQWIKDLRQRSRAGTMRQLERALHTTFSQTRELTTHLTRSTRRLSMQVAETARHMTMTSSLRSSDLSLLNFRKVKESMDERLPEIEVLILDNEPAVGLNFTMPRSALFVIDIQRELAHDPKTQIPHADRIRSAGEKILSAARDIIDQYRTAQTQSPSVIVFVQHEEKPDEGTLVRDTEPWKLVFEPRDGVQEERLVAKTTRSTFESNPDLADRLKAEDITEIVTFGIQSECCVVSTSKGAVEAGFKVTILQGAHSTYDTDSKSAVEIERDIEQQLRDKGADVVPWEDAVASWEQRRMISSYSIFSEL